MTEEEFQGQFQSHRIWWDYDPLKGNESPLEYKSEDWGWLEGRPVAVDYSVPAAAPKGEIEEILRNRAS
jgi:hypothetical protein